MDIEELKIPIISNDSEVHERIEVCEIECDDEKVEPDGISGEIISERINVEIDEGHIKEIQCDKQLVVRDKIDLVEDTITKYLREILNWYNGRSNSIFMGMEPVIYPKYKGSGGKAVSYTHLTLPTKA